MDEGNTISILKTILLIAGIFFLYSYFVLSSIAISRSKSKRLREYSRAGIPGAKFARIILIRANNYLLACQVGLLGTALLAGFILMRLFSSDSLFQLNQYIFGETWPYLTFAYAISVTFFSVAIIFAALLLVQVAKAVAFNAPERSLAWVAFSILIFARFISPLIFLLRKCGKSIVRLSGLKFPVERESVVSAEDISEMVELSSEAGEIEKEEKEMIKGVFAFSKKIVSDVMTPRKDVIAVSNETSLEEVVAVYAQEGLSRLIVYGEDLDDVRGILLSKDLIPYVGKVAPDFKITTLMRPAYFVPNTKEIGDLLVEFRDQAQHFAVVMDEHGGLDGVVTIEDLIEEIVGEIFDEYDNPAELGKSVRKSRSGDLIVDGSIEIDAINNLYKFDFPQGDYNTLAGFVIHTLGRMPEVGEQVKFENLLLKIEKIDQNRIELLRISNVKNSSSAQVSENSGKVVMNNQSEEPNQAANDRISLQG